MIQWTEIDRALLERGCLIINNTVYCYTDYLNKIFLKLNKLYDWTFYKVSRPKIPPKFGIFNFSNKGRYLMVTDFFLDRFKNVLGAILIRLK
jgi:hypothetical protein